MNFKQRLSEKIAQKQSNVCLGFDPDLNCDEIQPLLPYIRVARSKLDFAKQLIDVSSQHIACIKINTKFFHFYREENGREINEI